MNIQQAMERGITRLRLSSWNESAYLELTPLGNGKYGPWAMLHDPIGSGGVDQPVSVLVFEVDCGDYEEWVAPPAGQGLKDE